MPECCKCGWSGLGNNFCCLGLVCCVEERVKEWSRSKKWSYHIQIFYLDYLTPILSFQKKGKEILYLRKDKSNKIKAIDSNHHETRFSYIFIIVKESKFEKILSEKIYDQKFPKSILICLFLWAVRYYWLDLTNIRYYDDVVQDNLIKIEQALQPAWWIYDSSWSHWLSCQSQKCHSK